MHGTTTASLPRAFNPLVKSGKKLSTADYYMGSVGVILMSVAEDFDLCHVCAFLKDRWNGWKF